MLPSLRILLACLLATAAFALHAQDCPPIDLEQQKVQENACRAAGGQWSKFGVRDHLCNVYSCAPRTADGGKPCRNRGDCEYLCVMSRNAAVGTPAIGATCAPYRTAFGCNTHVDNGRVVGRVCLD